MQMKPINMNLNEGISTKYRESGRGCVEFFLIRCIKKSSLLEIWEPLVNSSDISNLATFFGSQVGKDLDNAP